MVFHGLEGSSASAFERARAGEGGGYIGALFQRGLVTAIGVPGTIIVLFAWLVIALAMTLDLSLQEMFKWVVPLWAKLKKRFSRPVKNLAALPGSTIPTDEQLDEFTPLTPAPADAETGPPARGDGAHQPAGKPGHVLGASKGG